MTQWKPGTSPEMVRAMEILERVIRIDDTPPDGICDTYAEWAKKPCKTVGLDSALEDARALLDEYRAGQIEPSFRHRVFTKVCKLLEDNNKLMIPDTPLARQITEIAVQEAGKP